MIDKSSLTLVIADDHPMLLSGLYDEMTRNGYNVIAKANNGELALQAILTEKPTIALLDIDMPKLSGFEVIKEAKEKGTKTKFIILSFHKETEYVIQAKKLQIDGYLLKEDAFEEIERCFEVVLNDGQYFSKSFAKAALEDASYELQKLKLLTPSEVTILKLVAQQKSTNDIADTLCVSSRTVEKHRSNIIDKLVLEKGTNMLTNWALVNKKLILEL
ncbi:response regulator transcription factor [Flavobacteriaceae bacterium TK19130]|nr:response regulator transcription factor [Thermobacterium salinum]